EEKSTTFPPGRTCGQRWLFSPSPSAVNGLGLPPAEGTIERPTCVSSDAMMLPSSPQLPPRPAGASHRITGSPPSTASFLSLPAAKKATHCPSGEKNGAYAPSLPRSSTSCDSSNRRVNNRDFPVEP